MNSLPVISSRKFISDKPKTVLVLSVPFSFTFFKINGRSFYGTKDIVVEQVVVYLSVSVFVKSYRLSFNVCETLHA